MQSSGACHCARLGESPDTCPNLGSCCISANRRNPGSGRKIGVPTPAGGMHTVVAILFMFDIGFLRARLKNFRFVNPKKSPTPITTSHAGVRLLPEGTRRDPCDGRCRPADPA